MKQRTPRSENARMLLGRETPAVIWLAFLPRPRAIIQRRRATASRLRCRVPPVVGAVLSAGLRVAIGAVRTLPALPAPVVLRTRRLPLRPRRTSLPAAAHTEQLVKGNGSSTSSKSRFLLKKFPSWTPAYEKIIPA